MIRNTVAPKNTINLLEKMETKLKLKNYLKF